MELLYDDWGASFCVFCFEEGEPLGLYYVLKHSVLLHLNFIIVIYTLTNYFCTMDKTFSKLIGHKITYLPNC